MHTAVQGLVVKISNIQFCDVHTAVLGMVVRSFDEDQCNRKTANELRLQLNKRSLPATCKWHSNVCVCV